MTSHSARKVKAFTLLFLAFALTITAFQNLPSANANVFIISMSPFTGNVGTTVVFNANITTINGSYTVTWDNTTLLASGNATVNNVNVTFAVPYASAGNHTVTVLDSNTTENVTRNFEITTAYYLNATVPETPMQMQEGNQTQLNLTITGAAANTTYIANVTVKAPTNSNYTKLVNMTTTSEGHTNITLIYPDEFTGASTNFTGTYKVAFNDTLATKEFFIGLTDRKEYHRYDEVNIKARGYATGENVTMYVLNSSQIAVMTENHTATDGTVQTTWTIPANTPIGTYTAKVNSTTGTTNKPAPDTQTFVIPGFNINITTRNLAGENTSGILVNTYENATLVDGGTSNVNGTVLDITLEIGNYTCNASYKGKLIGERQLEVNGSASVFFDCNLTNLRILIVAIKSGNEVRIPEAKMNLTSQLDNRTLTSDINGTATANSLLPNETYTLSAKRYEIIFNTTTLPTLLQNGEPKDWYDLKIICPAYTLRVNVTNPNADNQPITGVTVKVQESLGGLQYQETTANGAASFDCPLGNYTVRIYDADGIVLNQTTVILNTTTVDVAFSCQLYGLDITVKVVDYFGQLLTNVNITLQQGTWQNSKLPGTDGQTLFTGTTGGNIQVTVRLAGQTDTLVATTGYIDTTRTIELKVDRFTILAGMLVETSQLLTTILIALIVILILAFEVIRRRRRALPKKEEAEES